MYLMGVWVVVAHVPWPVLVLGFFVLTASNGRIADWLCDRFGPKS